MERLQKQIDTIRFLEDATAFLALVMAVSYIAYNVGLMNGRLGM